MPMLVTDALIREAARRLGEAASSPARVILFGSRSREDAWPDSDLDFLVVEQGAVSAYEETVRLRRALRGLGVPVDIVVCSAADAAAPTSLAVRDGLRDGVVLYDHAA